MKRKFILCTLFGSFLLAGTSCSNDSDPDKISNGPVALQITGGIQTRAYADTWEAGDAIGIYMLNRETAEASNKKYATAAGGTNGAFAPSTTGQTVYFPVDGSTRDFTAYYPYAAMGTAHLYAVDLTVQSPQKAIDLMAAAKVTGKSKADPAAAFVFEHKLVKIEVEFKGDGASITNDQLAGTVVKITGQQTAGTYDVVTGGEVSVTAGSATDIALPVTNLKAEGIVLPNTDTAGMLLTFAVPAPVDHTFTWAIKEAPKSQLFEAGRKYLYTITIAKTGLTVTSTVTDWTPGNGQEGETGNAE